MATQWLPWVILIPVTGVWSFLLDGIFIGATQTSLMRNSMILSLLVFAMASLILVPPMGNHGIWLSYHVMFVARTLTLMWYWPVLQRRISGKASVQ
jgi:MATE family multidrug resistance protein